MTYSLHQYLNAAGLKQIPSGLPDFKMPLTPRPHQVSGLNLLLAEVRFGLFDAAGTGKTMPMQAYALVNIAWGNKVVCLMPPVLLDQFVETTEENYLNSHRWLTWQIIDGGKGPAWRERKFRDWTKRQAWPGMLLMTYEMFAKLWPVLETKGYNVLITDEAQKLRGSESELNLVVMNYTKDPAEAALTLATGTPQHHTPIDCYAMTRFLDREVYKSLDGFKRKHVESHTDFVIKYQRNKFGVVKRRRIAVEVIDDYINLDLLHKNLYKHARRVEQAKVLSLKAPTIIPVHLTMAPAHQKIYDLMAKERMLEIGDRVITAEESQQLREHLMSIACNPNAYSEKKVKNVVFDYVVELLNTIGPDKKVAMYAHHNTTIEALADELTLRLVDPSDIGGWNEPPRLVYGGSRSSPTANRKSVQLFKKDPATKWTINHPQSGGVGLDYQKVCHHIIMVEPTPIQGDFAQVVARVQRSGQLYPVIIYVLILNGTVYPKMVQTMLDNNDRASRVNLDSTTFRSWITGGTEDPPF